MDPEAALNDLLDAVRIRDWDRVAEVADGLLRWMQQGGFPPMTVGPRELGIEWHRAIATFVCHVAKSKVRDARQRRRKGGG